MTAPFGASSLHMNSTAGLTRAGWRFGSGSARFSSALSARDFVRVTPFLDMDAESFGNLSEAASDLARLEMLEGHARAADVRRKR